MLLEVGVVIACSAFADCDGLAPRPFGGLGAVEKLDVAHTGNQADERLISQRRNS